MRLTAVPQRCAASRPPSVPDPGSGIARRCLVGACLALLTLLALLVLAAPRSLRADDGEVLLSRDGGTLRVSVAGDPDDEWRLESSEDLVSWAEWPGLGSLLSGRTNATVADLGEPADTRRFFRTTRTAGLFDPTLVRTLSLTFTQANWQTQLAANYSRGSNLAATLAFNGRTYPGVGVRYRGNTSYTMSGAKKSLNLEIDATDPDADLLRYDTLNLNNAFGDESLQREVLYFNLMRRYTVCPGATFARLLINGTYWGLYSCIQQQDGRMMNEWFPSNDGDRWRAPNMGGGGGGPGRPPGGGGGFGGGNSALTYLGATAASYRNAYELKSDNATNAWERLIHVIDVLNNSPADGFADRIQDVLAVDRWLWFLAAENVFADDDSYFNKGADYMMYFEPESGRLHPVEHDGNESFVANDLRLSPVQGATDTARPVLKRLLGVPEFRQRYCAHLRTLLEESFHPSVVNALIDAYRALTLEAIAADTRKGYSMTAYTNDLTQLRAFVQQRHAFLTNHAEIRPVPPLIEWVRGPATLPTPATAPFLTAHVLAQGTNGLDSVWLHYRPRSHGRFTATAMVDDGAHGDGTAGDGVFGAATPPFPAGTKVRFYVEARSANTAKAATFSPARAEQVTDAYRVGLTQAAQTQVVLNEFMAANDGLIADPQGDFDDWIELLNLTEEEVDLTGRYLTDDATNPRKWAFPEGTRIPAGGYLLVWADEDGRDAPGLHANFKLAAGGEEILLIDTDANLHAVLDSVVFGPQETNQSTGRTADNPEVFGPMEPTPGQPNR